MRPAIPDDVRGFILHAVPSVPYLEALLLMRGAGAVGWQAPALAAGLYLEEAAAHDLLSKLQAAAVVEPDPARPGSVRYAPAPALAALIDRLAEVYADNLVGVSMLIHSASAVLARAAAGRPRDD